MVRLEQNSKTLTRKWSYVRLGWMEVGGGSGGLVATPKWVLQMVHFVTFTLSPISLYHRLRLTSATFIVTTTTPGTTSRSHS